jgi:tRNA dimethylallyltransferase
MFNGKKMNKKSIIKPIIILGPTGSGKTEIAAELCRLAGGEIISADSRQVYKTLDIGTNKAGDWDKELKARVYKDIPQHLTDLINPDETFNAGGFELLADKAIQNLIEEGIMPVITGGTGLYIKALVDGLSDLPEADPEIREELTKELDSLGKEHLYNKLLAVDPVSAEKNKDNPQRLIRALEVFQITGKPISELQAIKPENKREFLQFGLAWDREELYENLDKRSSLMLSSGMIEETKLMLENFGENAPALKGIGYGHIIKHLNKQLSYANMEMLFKRDMRRYAKRQMTWFRRDHRISWIKLDKSTFNPPDIAEQIFNKIPKMIQ